MNRNSYLPPFGKIFFTSVILLIIGGSGLVYLVWLLEPRLGPRWLMYFFLTAAGTGFALPIVYIFQRRMAKARVDAAVLVRESILFAVFLDLLLWMQIGRILSNLIIFFLACGLVLLEIFLRMAEKATFDASES